VPRRSDSHKRGKLWWQARPSPFSPA
jgi:hypothetical protein